MSISWDIKYRSVKRKIYTNKRNCKQTYTWEKRHISWPSNRLVESTKFIEANNIFLFTLWIYYHHIKTFKHNIIFPKFLKILLDNNANSSCKHVYWQSRNYFKFIFFYFPIFRQRHYVTKRRCQNTIEFLNSEFSNRPYSIRRLWKEKKIFENISSEIVCGNVSSWTYLIGLTAMRNEVNQIW